eukprot:scaffold11904_cov17-Tisochrysis_lutea.AAC.3
MEAFQLPQLDTSLKSCLNEQKRFYAPGDQTHKLCWCTLFQGLPFLIEMDREGLMPRQKAGAS